MKYNQNTSFPVGYHKFHEKQLYNFQLNRWYSIGYARLEDMLEAGKNIKKYCQGDGSIDNTSFDIDNKL